MNSVRFALLLAIVAGPALAQTQPPDNALPLSQILAGIESNGKRTVYAAEFERGRWEIVSCPGRSRFCNEDDVDPITGNQSRAGRNTVIALLPLTALPASSIAAQVEAAGIGTIVEMSFDDRRWEVELRQGIRRAELRIEPSSGAIQRCEGSLCP
jgi:hypothetical protein